MIDVLMILARWSKLRSIAKVPIRLVAIKYTVIVVLVILVRVLKLTRLKMEMSYLA